MSKTFRELKVSLGQWLDVNGQDPTAADSDELPESIRGEIINLSIRELLRKHDTKFGQFSATFQAAAEQLDYDPPPAPVAGVYTNGIFSRPKLLWYLDPDHTDESVVLDFVEKDEFDARYPISGLFGYTAPMGSGAFGQTGLADPIHYTYWDRKIQLGPVPNRPFTIFITGYKLLPDLITANQTNSVTIEAWEYVLFKGLSLSSLFGIEDERMPMWEQKANAIAMDLAVEHYAAKASAKRMSQSMYPG